MKRFIKKFFSGVSYGFTLLEIIISLTVIAVVSVAAAKITVTARNNSTRYSMLQEARNTSTNMIEIFKCATSEEEFDRLCKELVPSYDDSSNTVSTGQYTITATTSFESRSNIVITCTNVLGNELFNITYTSGVK